MSPRPDPVRLEVFHHLFAALAEEMGVSLMRSAFSPNIKERRDFSCGAAALATLMRHHWGDDQISEARLLDETVRMLKLHELKDRIE